MATIDDLEFVEITVEGHYYEVKAKDTTISGDLEIPSTYNDLPVSGIRSSGFSDCVGLTSVTVPASIGLIPTSAFKGCTGLTTFTSLSADLYFASEAFSGCTSLATLNISSTRPKLDGLLQGNSYIFKNCTSLTSIDLSLFATGSFNVPKGCFYGCTGLTEITLPANTSKIGASAFEGCTGITSITIPSTVAAIGDRAFAGCSALAEFKFEGAAITAGTDVLADTPNLASISAPNNAGWGDTWGGKTVVKSGGGRDPEDGLVFELIDGGKSYSVGVASVSSVFGAVEIPAEHDGLPVTAIRDNAFSGCKYVTSVSIPDTVTSIGAYAFNGCSGLVSAPLPAALTSIGMGAFYNCTSLSAVSIPETVTNTIDSKNNIGVSAFSGCFGLKSVTFSSTFLPKSGLYTLFAGCSGISSITVVSGKETNCYAEGNCLFYASSAYPKDVTTLVMGCKASVIPRGVKYISDHAFYGCTGLESITIPDTVVGIYSSAFEGCTGLSSFTLDGNLISESAYVFYNTNSLKFVSVRPDAEGWGDTWNGKPVSADYATSLVFSLNADGTSYSVAANKGAALEEVEIPDMYQLFPVTAVAENGFSECENLFSVKLPSSIVSVGAGAFSKCPSLEYVLFNGDCIPEADDVFSDTPYLEEVHVYYGASGWGDTWCGKTVVFDEREKTNYRVIPMQCGNDESYALVFYEQDDSVKVDVYDASTKEMIATVVAPFPVGGIPDIRYVQSYDVLFFAQPDTYPCKLKREDDEEAGGYKFTFENSEFLPEPVMEWNEKDEHNVFVFSFPDEELIEEDAAGNRYYPKGVIRSRYKQETLTFSYSGLEADARQPESYTRHYKIITKRYKHKAGTHKATIKLFASADSSFYDKYEVGTTVYFSEPLAVDYSVYWETDNARGELNLSIEAADNSKVQVSGSCAFFQFGVVSRRSNGKVVLYLGTISASKYFSNSKNRVYLRYSASSAKGVTGEVSYGETQFYTTIVDNVPEDAELTDANYYTPIVPSRAKCAVLIDGAANNEKISVGQVIAIRKRKKIYESALWDYEEIPAGTKADPPPVPAVELLDKLQSKKDWNSKELRPSLGGGVGFACEWIPIRGTVTVKTEGIWSGVLELQDIGEDGNVYTLATISSENGLSNTELERDITDFGRAIRVACTRREIAYETNRSVSGEGKVYEKVVKSDNGCQWSITCTDDYAGFLRITGIRSLKNGTSVYEAEIIGGISGPISTNTYALGAWSTKNGYPRHITIFQERLVYAGNKEKPMTVWMSKTNKWKDFELGTEDTSAITATLATEKYDSIEWLTLNKNSILLGSRYNEFSIGANDGTVTTADNILASTMSNIGGASIPAAKVGTTTLMVKVGREELHKVEFNALSEQSTGTQVSMLARHLFEGDRIEDVFSIQSPRNMLFCIHESGKLSSMTYEQEFDVLGFARHDILDGVESGCVIRRGGRDVLCLIVREGDSYVLGEIDFDSEVWTDDGKNYESEVITTPLKPPRTTRATGYGRTTNIAGADVYVSEDSRQFKARLQGADWVRVDNGFDTDGKLRGWEEQRVELPTTGGWVNEPIVEVVCNTAHPLTVYGVGAAIAEAN